MKRKTLLAMVSCFVVTLSPVIAAAPNPSKPTEESVNELLILLINQKVDISIRSQRVSPEGDIIIETNGNTYFADRAIITIEASKLGDLDEVVSQLWAVMKVSSGKNNRIKSMTLSDSISVPVTYEKNQLSAKGSADVDLKDSRAWVLYDFKKVTKYPELIDDDFENGDLDYMFYRQDDFVTVTICGVDDEDKISSVLDEVKSIMIRRDIEQYLVVNIYEKKIRMTESSATLENLIKTMEIKDF